jgi:hypothetical protein
MQPCRQPHRLMDETMNLFQPQPTTSKNADDHASRFGA